MGSTEEVSPGWNDIDKTRFFVLGPICSLFVRTLVYPPMLIKVRQQVMVDHPEFRTLRRAFAHIVRHEGMGGLYKGFAPSILGIPVGQLYLTTYEIVRHRIGEVLPRTTSGRLTRDFLAGMTATAVAQTVGVPIGYYFPSSGEPHQKMCSFFADIITQKLQADPDPKMTRGLPGQMRLGWRVGVNIVKEHGVAGLYRGMSDPPLVLLWGRPGKKKQMVHFFDFHHGNPGSDFEDFISSSVIDPHV